MSEQTDQRKALLQKWFELEPQDVLPKPQRDEVTAWGGNVSTRAILLGWVIRAIRERGWHYCLASDETEPENEQPAAWHKASIFPDTSFVMSDHEGMAEEPCDAMLSAYVQALEATKEKE